MPSQSSVTDRFGGAGTFASWSSNLTLRPLIAAPTLGWSWPSCFNQSELNRICFHNRMTPNVLTATLSLGSLPILGLSRVIGRGSPGASLSLSSRLVSSMKPVSLARVVLQALGERLPASRMTVWWDVGAVPGQRLPLSWVACLEALGVGAERYREAHLHRMTGCTPALEPWPAWLS